MLCTSWVLVFVLTINSVCFHTLDITDTHVLHSKPNLVECYLGTRGLLFTRKYRLPTIHYYCYKRWHGVALNLNCSYSHGPASKNTSNHRNALFSFITEWLKKKNTNEVSVCMCEGDCCLYYTLLIFSNIYIIPRYLLNVYLYLMCFSYLNFYMAYING